MIRNGQCAGTMLQAKGAHLLRCGADETYSSRSALLCKVRLLAKEAIAGMNCVSTCVSGDIKDLVSAEVAFGRRATTDAKRFVRLYHVTRQCISLRVDRHAFQPHAAQRTDDPASDGAAIGDENLFKHELLSLAGLE